MPPDPQELHALGGSANHLIVDQLNFPHSIFIDEKVDNKELKGVNDPYQLVRSVLGKSDFPETAVLNVTSNLIKQLKHVLNVAFGKEFQKASTSGEIKRVLHENGYLNANEKL